jgi:protein-arginine deiminase
MKLTAGVCRRRAASAAVLLIAACAAAAAAEPAGPLRLTGPGGGATVRLLANRDDDDRDGRADADDDRVNGAADLADLAAIAIESGDPGITEVALSCDAAAIGFFLRDGEAWRRLAVDERVSLEAGRAELLVECRQWATAEPAWDGRAALTAVGTDPAGREGRVALAVEVVPVTLVPETRPVREVFVSRGRYDNEAFVSQLKTLLDAQAVPLRVHDAAAWQEMWMQDTMELGAAAASGHDGGEQTGGGMTVVLPGLRGVDPFPETLLGPDVAIARVAEPRALAGGDAWADWYGNLMVSPATEAWPNGRVIYGRNTATGEQFHPGVIAFLAAQQMQSPVWIDTSWLLIKHVDEIVAFVPGRDGRGYLLVVDPLAGLAQAQAAGLAAVVGPRAEAVAEANRRIAAIIESVLTGGGAVPRAGAAGVESGDESATEGLLGLIGWDSERVIRLPVAFEPPAGPLPETGLTDATSLWSNPVNMLFVNGTVLCGDAEMPPAVREACRAGFLAAGAERVEFLDDACYQRMKGNVHCATNSRREP